MRRPSASLIIGVAVLLASCLTPGSASARQATWTVTPGGAFTGQGTIDLDDTTCFLRFAGSFFDGSGKGRIEKVTVHGCAGSGALGYPSFRVPIAMTATTYLKSIDTVAAPLSGFIIDIQGSCPLRLAGPGGPDDPAKMIEILYQNETAEMWWSTGIGGGLTVWDPLNCYAAETVPIRNKFTITPAQTIRPTE